MAGEQIPILILAAGQSRRMRGADKLAMTLGGVPQLRRMVDAACVAGGPVYVALPARDHSRADLLAGSGASLLAVPEAAEGMGGTLRGAVAQLPEAAAFMVVLADLVEIGAGEIGAVLAARHSAPGARAWRGATEDGAPGHPVLFDASLRSAFGALQGDMGAGAVLGGLGGAVHLVPLPGQRARRDLDTPEDWAAYRAAQSD